MATPEQVLHQQRTALKHANHIRTWRMRLKENIKANKVEITQLLLEPPQEIETMEIMNLLVAVPALGPVKVKSLLRACYISPTTTIGDLTERQRAEIVRLLRRR